MRDLILSLVREYETFYGDDETQGMSDDDKVSNFLSNHHPSLVQSAANGDIDDIVALRAALGLPIIR